MKEKESDKKNCEMEKRKKKKNFIDKKKLNKFKNCLIFGNKKKKV
jgi:hypothetical protein